MQPGNNQFVDELIRQLRYLDGVLVAPAIPQKKVNNALAKNSYIGNDPIIGLIDCTVFGSAKDHIMFTAGGMFWNHPSSSPTNGSITYTDFVSCFFKSSGFFSGIDTGIGIEISQAVSSVTKNELISLLNNLKNIISSNQQFPNNTPPNQHNVLNNQFPNNAVQPELNKGELLALAHNMSEAKNWDAAINAYEKAGEFRMAGLVREKQAQWNRSHN